MMMTFFLLSMEVSFAVRRARSGYRVDIYLSGHLTNTPYIFVSYHAKNNMHQAHPRKHQKYSV